MKKNTTDITEKIEQPIVFLKKQKITNHYKEISVPKNAVLLRAASKYVKFFKGNKPQNSVGLWAEIPKGVCSVSFPEYREHYGRDGIGINGSPCHVYYGTPSFQLKQDPLK